MPPLASTAIVMPVFNEDVSRVFEGLRVVYRSVQETKKLEHFDFFILSDSNQPNQWISGGGRVGRALQTGRRLREDFLSKAPTLDQQEGGQRRRLPASLGT